MIVSSEWERLKGSERWKSGAHRVGCRLLPISSPWSHTKDGESERLISCISSNAPGVLWVIPAAPPSRPLYETFPPFVFLIILANNHFGRAAILQRRRRRNLLCTSTSRRCVGAFVSRTARVNWSACVGLCDSRNSDLNKSKAATTSVTVVFSRYTQSRPKVRRRRWWARSH